jgi:ribosomal protein S18 acetylase RimI-like enzyme
MNPGPQVRIAASEDEACLARTLARAFEDDPLFLWLLPRDRRARLEVLFRATLRHVYLKRANAWTSEDALGAALWMPPGEWALDLAEVVRVAPAAVHALGRALPRAFSALRAVEERHLRTPHHYLAVLGVDPDRQGRGYGAALLAPTLARCDREGATAWLETAKEANLGFYRRHGFAVEGRVDTDGGPSIWLMRRAPAVPRP